MLQQGAFAPDAACVQRPGPRTRTPLRTSSPCCCSRAQPQPHTTPTLPRPCPPTELKPSTALSQACITAGALASMAANLPRRHPHDRRAPLIDFPLILMLTPVLLVGVGLGASQRAQGR